MSERKSIIARGKLERLRRMVAQHDAWHALPFEDQLNWHTREVQQRIGRMTPPHTHGPDIEAIRYIVAWIDKQLARRDT